MEAVVQKRAIGTSLMPPDDNKMSTTRFEMVWLMTIPKRGTEGNSPADNVDHAAKSTSVFQTFLSADGLATEKPFGPEATAQMSLILENMVALNDSSYKFAVLLESTPAVMFYGEDSKESSSMGCELYKVEQERAIAEARLVRMGRTKNDILHDVEICQKARKASVLRGHIKTAMCNVNRARFALISTDQITVHELEEDLWATIKLMAEKRLTPIADRNRWMLVSIYTKGLHDGVGQDEKILFMSCGMTREEKIRSYKQHEGIFPLKHVSESDMVRLFDQEVVERVAASKHFYKHQKTAMALDYSMVMNGPRLDKCLEGVGSINHGKVAFLRVRLLETRVAKLLLGDCYRAMDLKGEPDDRDFMGNYPAVDIVNANKLITDQQIKGADVRNGGEWCFKANYETPGGMEVDPYSFIRLLANAKRSVTASTTLMIEVEDATPGIIQIIKLHPATHSIMRAAIFRVATQLILAAGHGGPDNRYSEESCLNYARGQIWRSLEHVFTYRLLKLTGTDDKLSPLLNMEIITKWLDMPVEELDAVLQNTRGAWQEKMWEESLDSDAILDLAKTWSAKYPDQSKLIGAIAQVVNERLMELRDQADSMIQSVSATTARFIWMAITRQRAFSNVFSFCRFYPALVTLLRNQFDMDITVGDIPEKYKHVKLIKPSYRKIIEEVQQPKVKELITKLGMDKRAPRVWATEASTRERFMRSQSGATAQDWQEYYQRVSSSPAITADGCFASGVHAGEVCDFFETAGHMDQRMRGYEQSLSAFTERDYATMATESTVRPNVLFIENTDDFGDFTPEVQCTGLLPDGNPCQEPRMDRYTFCQDCLQLASNVERQLGGERHQGVEQGIEVTIMRGLKWKIDIFRNRRKLMQTPVTLSSVYHPEAEFVTSFDRLATIFQIAQDVVNDRRRYPSRANAQDYLRNKFNGLGLRVNLEILVEQVESLVRCHRAEKEQDWRVLVPKLRFLAARQGFVNFDKVFDDDMEKDLKINKFHHYNVDHYAQGEEVRSGKLPALNLDYSATKAGLIPYANDPRYENNRWASHQPKNVIGQPAPIMCLIENKRVARFAEARHSEAANTPRKAYMILSIERCAQANGSNGNHHRNDVKYGFRRGDSQNIGKDGFQIGLLSAGKSQNIRVCHTTKIEDLKLLKPDGNCLTEANVQEKIRKICYCGARFGQLRHMTKQHRDIAEQYPVGHDEREKAEKWYIQALLPLLEINLFKFIDEMNGLDCDVFLLSGSQRASGAWIRGIRLGHLEFHEFLAQPRIARKLADMGLDPNVRSLDHYLPEVDLALITPIIESDRQLMKPTKIDMPLSESSSDLAWRQWRLEQIPLCVYTAHLTILRKDGQLCAQNYIIPLPGDILFWSTFAALSDYVHAPERCTIHTPKYKGIRQLDPKTCQRGQPLGFMVNRSKDRVVAYRELVKGHSPNELVQQYWTTDNWPDETAKGASNMDDPPKWKVKLPRWRAAIRRDKGPDASALDVLAVQVAKLVEQMAPLQETVPADERFAKRLIGHATLSIGAWIFELQGTPYFKYPLDHEREIFKDALALGGKSLMIGSWDKEPASRGQQLADIRRWGMKSRQTIQGGIASNRGLNTLGGELEDLAALRSEETSWVRIYPDMTVDGKNIHERVEHAKKSARDLANPNVQFSHGQVIPGWARKTEAKLVKEQKQPQRTVTHRGGSPSVSTSQGSSTSGQIRQSPRASVSSTSSSGSLPTHDAAHYDAQATQQNAPNMGNMPEWLSRKSPAFAKHIMRNTAGSVPAAVPTRLSRQLPDEEVSTLQSSLSRLGVKEIPNLAEIQRLLDHYSVRANWPTNSANQNGHDLEVAAILIITDQLNPAAYAATMMDSERFMSCWPSLVEDYTKVRVSVDYTSRTLTREEANIMQQLQDSYWTAFNLYGLVDEIHRQLINSAAVVGKSVLKPAAYHANGPRSMVELYAVLCYLMDDTLIWETSLAQSSFGKSAGLDSDSHEDM